MPPSKKPSPSPLWLFLTEPGLSRLLALELKYRKTLAQKARITTLFLRNYDLLVLPDSQVTSRRFASRLALHVMACPVFGRFTISKAQLDALAEAWKRDRPDGLVASIAGSKFQRQDLLRWVSKELGARGVTVPKGEAPRRPCWFIAVDESYYFGLPRFNYHEATGRERASDRSGSLPPVIAAAMGFAAKPGAQEVIWDPVMGTGTVIREAAALAPDARIIGSDTDAAAVAIARQALAKAKNIKLITGDSTSLDLGRNDLTLTLANLPFGKQFQPEQGTPALYEALLRQSLKAAAPNWRAVLLTSDHEALRQAVQAVGNLTLEKATSVKTRGLAADIWLVTRSRPARPSQ